MDLLNAMKVVALMRERDTLLAMRSASQSLSKSGWTFMVNDSRFPIPSEVKKIFSEAIEKSLDYYNSEIEKL